jgi:hypothetical protein
MRVKKETVERFSWEAHLMSPKEAALKISGHNGSHLSSQLFRK